MGLWMGSLDRSWQELFNDVGLAHVGRVVLAVDGLKDAPAWSKSGASQLAAQVVVM